MKRAGKYRLGLLLIAPVIWIGMNLIAAKAGQIAGTPIIVASLTSVPAPVPPTPAPIRPLLNHNVSWQQLAISSDGQRIFSTYMSWTPEILGRGGFYGAEDEQGSIIRAWDAHTQKPLWDTASVGDFLDGQGQDHDFSLSPDGTLLLVNPRYIEPLGGADSNVQAVSAIYDAHTGRKLWTLPVDSLGLFAYGRDDLWVFHAHHIRVDDSRDNDSYTEQVQICDARTGELRRQFYLPNAFVSSTEEHKFVLPNINVFEEDYSTLYVRQRDGSALALVPMKRGVSVWKISSSGKRRQTTSIRCSGRISDPALSPDGRFLAFVSYQSESKPQHLTVWNLPKGHLEFQTSFPILNSIQWSNDSRTLGVSIFSSAKESDGVSLSYKGFYLCRLKAGRPIGKFIPDPEKDLLGGPAAAFYPDSQRLLLGDGGGLRTLPLLELLR